MTPLPPGDEVGEDLGDAASGRRQGLPEDVIPLQVVAGFFESERGNRASGARVEGIMV
jgi:hypothetical protein